MLLLDPNTKGFFILNFQKKVFKIAALDQISPDFFFFSFPSIMMNSHQQLQQNKQMGSGLTRYRSAPSSYFASLMSSPGSDGGFGADDLAQLFNPRASSPETQIIFSQFMNGSDAMALPPQPRKSEAEEYQPPPPQMQRSNDYSSGSQMMYANPNSEAAPDSAAVDRVFASFNSSSAPAQPKIERAAVATSSLIRHSSSPAGLFANINIENGNFLTCFD